MHLLNIIHLGIGLLEYSGLTWTSLTEGSIDCLPAIDRTDCIKYSLYSE